MGWLHGFGFLLVQRVQGFVFQDFMDEVFKLRGFNWFSISGLGFRMLGGFRK